MEAFLFPKHYSQAAGIFIVVLGLSGKAISLLPENKSTSSMAGFSANSVCISYSEPYLLLAMLSHASHRSNL